MKMKIANSSVNLLEIVLSSHRYITNLCYLLIFPLSFHDTMLPNNIMFGKISFFTILRKL